jgi:hypothetical protein
MANGSRRVSVHNCLYVTVHSTLCLFLETGDPIGSSKVEYTAILMISSLISAGRWSSGDLNLGLRGIFGYEGS